MVSSENDPRRAGTIWTIELDQPIPVIKPLIDVKFSRLGSESVNELAKVIGENHSKSIIQRFESGRQCYAANVEDQIAAYGWVSFEEEFIGELNLRLRLLPGEAYIWDCFTFPLFRRNHLYSALLTFILNELRAAQFHRVWIGADFDNLASQRGIANAGFRHVADLVLARVPTPRQIWLQGEPDVPESLVEKARRAFLNN